jgi:hypothetical protein
MQSEKKVSRVSRSARLIWILVAAIAAYGSTVGGDTSILCGWLLLVWTAPFSIIWWSYLYDAARLYLPVSIAQPLGLVVIIALAYAFWFWMIPTVWSKAKASGIAHR